MEKLWYYGKAYDTILKNYGILINYGKNYSTIVNYRIR